MVVHPAGQAQFAVALHGIRADRDNWDATTNSGFRLTVADGAGGLKAIHNWHPAVHQHETESFVFHRVERGGAISHNDELVPEAGERGGDDFLIDRVILGHQDLAIVTAAHRWRVALGRIAHGRRKVQGRLGHGPDDTHGRATAFCRIDADITTHRINDFLDDTEPKPCPVELFCCRVISLFKWLEHAGFERIGHADAGVGYCEFNADFLLPLGNNADFYRQRARIGEFERVRDQVLQNQCQLQRVANHRDGRHTSGQLQPVVEFALHGLSGHFVEPVPNEFQQVELDNLEVQLAGIDP